MFLSSWYGLFSAKHGNSWPLKSHEVSWAISICIMCFIDMVTSSKGNIFRVTGPLCGEFTDGQWISPHKGHWRRALVFYFICAWTNGWAGDLWRHRAHYDVTLMEVEWSYEFLFLASMRNYFIYRCHLSLEERYKLQIYILISSKQFSKSWWRHQMETLSALDYWPFVRGIHRSLVNSSHKGDWRGALMFSLICAWTNGCVKN